MNSIYISLLENVRVRRAGYCYRKEFGKFIERLILYQNLC